MINDDMPEGWEAAARDGWDENPAARAARAEAERWRRTMAKLGDTDPPKSCVEIPCPPVVKATFGRVAYDAYLRYSDGKSLVTGEALPTWDNQKPDRQAAWDAAADEVVQQYEHFRGLIKGGQ